MAIVDSEHKNFYIFSADCFFGEPFVGLMQPKSFLHDEILMNFMANDLIDGSLIVVLFVKSEQFEPVGYFIVATCDVFLLDEQSALDKYLLDLLLNHLDLLL